MDMQSVAKITQLTVSELQAVWVRKSQRVSTLEAFL
jgi:hypothetical protein